VNSWKSLDNLNIGNAFVGMCNLILLQSLCFCAWCLASAAITVMSRAVWIEVEVMSGEKKVDTWVWKSLMEDLKIL